MVLGCILGGTCWNAWVGVICVSVVYKILDYVVRIPQVGKLSERYVFITGCDTGFGNMTAKRLDKLGVHVFAGCYCEKGETDLRKECSSNLKTVPLDVSKPESIKKAYAFVRSCLPAGKGLWAVLNNAGVSGELALIEWQSIKEFENVLKVNVYGLIDVTKTFLPLVKMEHGRIINTASAAGRMAPYGAAPYAVSKYAVEAFSDSLRRQLRPYNVSVHIIEPGAFRTPMVQEKVLMDGLHAGWNRLSPEFKEEYGPHFLDEFGEYMVQKLFLKIASPNPALVADAYMQSVLCCFPRARYVVGPDAKYIWLPLQWMPEWMGDKMMEVLTPGKPIPAGARNKDKLAM